MWNWNGYGGLGFGVLLMVVFWALVVLGVMTLFRWLTGDSPFDRRQSWGPPRRDKTAIEILQERYARGEIGREEFEQKRRDLGA
ncbi:putative membrane protein [Variovorax sp. HW608]|nr:putative membrane protein [Variovorax sp. HW608]